MRASFRFLLLPVVLTLTLAASAQQPAPLRVAIIGMEHGHVEGFLQYLPQRADVQLVGIADSDAALIAKYTQRFGLDHKLFYDNVDAMVAATHPEALLVYTSTAGHLAAIQAAGRNHLPVMVEKPLTISVADALAIRRIAREQHIPVIVNYETTWYASNRRAHDEVDAGHLGAIRRLVIHDGHEGPIEIGVGPEFMKWLGDPELNGAGALYDFGCYGADLATWLMHGEVPLTVTAIVTTDKPEKYPRVDDDATVVLAYPHAQVVIQASWNWPFGRKDMEVYGATGQAITVGNERVRLRLPHEAEEKLITAAPLTGADNNSLAYLTAVVRSGVVPKGDLGALDTNMVVMQILDAARESARTGKSVRLKKLAE